ncbi:MAG: hypothetical protein ACJ74M_10360 [Gaiellaceae bacterium]
MRDARWTGVPVRTGASGENCDTVAGFAETEVTVTGAATCAIPRCGCDAVWFVGRGATVAAVAGAASNAFATVDVVVVVALCVTVATVAAALCVTVFTLAVAFLVTGAVVLATVAVAAVVVPVAAFETVATAAVAVDVTAAAGAGVLAVGAAACGAAATGVAGVEGAAGVDGVAGVDGRPACATSAKAAAPRTAARTTSERITVFFAREDTLLLSPPSRPP